MSSTVSGALLYRSPCQFWPLTAKDSCYPVQPVWDFFWNIVLQMSPCWITGASYSSSLADSSAPDSESAGPLTARHSVTGLVHLVVTPIRGRVGTKISIPKVTCTARRHHFTCLEWLGISKCLYVHKKNGSLEKQKGTERAALANRDVCVENNLPIKLSGSHLISHGMEHW